MLDEITDCAVSGWLQDVFLKDEEYQKLGEEEKKAAAPQEVFPPGIIPLHKFSLNHSRACAKIGARW